MTGRGMDWQDKKRAPLPVQYRYSQFSAGVLMLKRTFVCLATLILILSIAQAAPKGSAAADASAHLPAPAIAALQTIDPEKIRAHVKFLASDLLEGRGTGARGGDIAAEYIATQLALYGLKPAGDNGSYMQKVPMVGIETKDDSTFALVPDKGQPMELRNRADYVAMDETGEA